MSEENLLFQEFLRLANAVESGVLETDAFIMGIEAHFFDGDDSYAFWKARMSELQTVTHFCTLCLLRSWPSSPFHLWLLGGKCPSVLADSCTLLHPLR